MLPSFGCEYTSSFSPAVGKFVSTWAQAKCNDRRLQKLENTVDIMHSLRLSTLYLIENTHITEVGMHETTDAGNTIKIAPKRP